VPVRRLLTTASLLLTAAVLAWPVGAVAQSGPQELWEAYPLDPRAESPSAPASGAPRGPAVAPGGSGDDLSLPLMLAIAAGGICLAALIALTAVPALRGRGRSAPVAEPAALPAPAPDPAPRASRRPRPPRDERDALELARLSADYLDVVASGSRRPVVDVAERRACNAERVRRELGRARACGLLLGAGRGKAGGTLSDEAVRLLRGSPPPVTERHVLGVGSNGRKGGG
jgi:hypothetical protein